MNYIITYYNLIVSGKIRVSKKLRKTFDKVVKDLTDMSSKYRFDINKANRPIEFIEKFCKHSKGKWIGKPVILDLWQKAIIQTIFGFLDENGNRKYKEVLLIVGRKNGKSTLLSAIALYMLFADGEGGAQVCCVASKKDQAKIVFNEELQQNVIVKSKSEKKDQTYVLYGIEKEKLNHIIFPLADFENKDEIREVLKQENLEIISAKKDSQEICFVKDNDFGKFLEESAGLKGKRGKVVDKNGNVLGEHKGLIYYTIGQRRGLRNSKHSTIIYS